MLDFAESQRIKLGSTSTQSGVYPADLNEASSSFPIAKTRCRCDSRRNLLAALINFLLLLSEACRRYARLGLEVKREGAFHFPALQPARGVIHPSFPLRGRWGRSASVGEQAPSPSLAFFRKRHLKCTHAPYLANYAPVPADLRCQPKSPEIHRFPDTSAMGSHWLIPKGATQSSTESRLGKYGNTCSHTGPPSTLKSKIPPSPEPFPYPCAPFGESTLIVWATVRSSAE